MESIFTDYISPFLLAILQGVTEFLPVSSSGHLVLLNSVMPVDAGLLFDLILHLATLVSVVIFYRGAIAEICAGCLKELRQPCPKTNLKFVGSLLVATAVTAVLGLLLSDAVETHLRSTLVVGILLVVNAGILWVSQKRGAVRLSDGTLNLKTAALIGLCQGIAVLPGISRSGSTITAALILGVEPRDCAKISFLLSIPVICGAVILHIPQMSQMESGNLAVVLGAAAVAAAVGYASLVLLESILKKANFHRFAPYCLIVGILAIAGHFVV